MTRKRGRPPKKASNKKIEVQSESSEEEPEYSEEEEESEYEDDEEEVPAKKRRHPKKSKSLDSFTVERPLGMMLFEEIHKLYFKDGDQRFAEIFQTWNESTKKTTAPVSQYFYQTKWLDFAAGNSGFIQDSEFPEAAYRTEYRILNGLPKDGLELGVIVEVPAADNYQPPRIYRRDVKIRRVPTLENGMNITLYNAEYNEKYGMFPLNSSTYTRNEDWVHADDGTKRFVGYSTVANTKNIEDKDELVKQHQLSNQECLRLLINHDNIVAMHDMFFWESPFKQLVIVSVEEWCPQSLKDRIEAEQEDLDWKRVCKDILTALSLLHKYGTHGGISLENIRYNRSKDCHQLTGFKNFRFTNSKRPVLWESTEFAPRKFGIPEETLMFDTSVDLYALAICILHIKAKGLKFNDLSSLSDIENTIEDTFLLFDQNDEKRFVRRMLRARMWMHKGMAKHRLSTKSFLAQLEYLSDVKYSKRACYYLHNLTGIFTNETLYYTSTDVVQDVIKRLVSPLYPNGTEVPEYVMTCSIQFSVASCPSLVVPDQEPIRGALDLIARNNNHILILPRLKTKEEAGRKESRYEIRFTLPQELGMCPILVMCHNTITEEQMKTFILHNVVSKQNRRNCKVVLKRREGRKKEHNELCHEAYQIDLVDGTDSLKECVNRLNSLNEFDEKLEGAMLEMTDIGGRCGF